MESEELPAEQILEQIEQFGEGIHRFGGAFPKFWPNYGPGLMTAFLGSDLHIRPDTVWFDPLTVEHLSEIQPRFDPQNLWWQRVQKLTTLATQRWDGRVMVGFTDLGGNLDILASLRGSEKLLLDLSDSPEEVLALLAEITCLWMQYYDQLFDLTNGKEWGTSGWSPLWTPGKLYMLQSDFSYMISPRMFKRFAMLAPLLPGCEDLPNLLAGKVDFVILDRMNYHHADWFYRKYGLEEKNSDGYFDLAEKSLRLAFNRLGIECQV